MALNSKLINRITDLTAADVVHTHSYAKAQRNSPRPVSNMSFSERKELESNRQYVKSYKHAQVYQRSSYYDRDRRSMGASGAGMAATGVEPATQSRMDAHIDHARFGHSYGATQQGSNMTARQQMTARFEPKRPLGK